LLLLGVEDTADGKQYRIKGQKNEENNENNRFVRQRSFLRCTVSSRPRRSQKTCFEISKIGSMIYRSVAIKR